MKIVLTDNNIGSENNIYNRNDIADLFPITDIKIEELCKEHKSLLIFPPEIKHSDDRIGSSYILNILNTTNPDQVRLTTNNIMGFIGIGNLQIKIKSRFDEGREDYLLHYMLQKVLSFNLFDFRHNKAQEDVFDFIMFMFPYYLNNALQQGIYRAYKNFTHNDSNIRGTINLNRHIKNNVPFIGNIAYSTREHSDDNDMTQLIRHTIEFIMTKKYGNAILNMNRETINNVKFIVDHTQSYKKSERSIVINKNLRQRSHPFYTEYMPLQALCIQILRMEEVKYGNNNDDIFGIIFDGAWLWEEYVNTILKDYGFIHAENKIKKGGIFLFEDIDVNGDKHFSGVRYPDFYKDGMVLDAKYKRLANYEKISDVDRNDIHQIITYMNNLNSIKGGFIAPFEHKQTKVPTSQLRYSKSSISIYGIEICKNAKSYYEFCNQMQKHETIFINRILEAEQEM